MDFQSLVDPSHSLPALGLMSNKLSLSIPLASKTVHSSWKSMGGQPYIERTFTIATCPAKPQQFLRPVQPSSAFHDHPLLPLSSASQNISPCATFIKPKRSRQSQRFTRRNLGRRVSQASSSGWSCFPGCSICAYMGHRSTFFGGHTADWATPKDQYAWFKDFAININDQA